MTLGAVCLTALFQLVQNQSWGFGPVRNLGFVKADDPLWLALLRTPLSLFVPALDLPVWGALAQVLLVFGIAEITLGRWRTLVIAYVSTLAGTTYARIGVSLDPEGLFGLPLRTPWSSTPARRRRSSASRSSSAGATGPGARRCWWPY